MPRAKQTSLDFPVRKNSSVTRSRSKRLVNKENIPSPRKRVSNTVTSENLENLGCSPTKRSRCWNKENAVKSPALCSPKRAPLSPRVLDRIPPHGYQVLDIPTHSPRGILTPSKKENVLTSPRNTVISPKADNSLTKIRALKFSSPQETGYESPSRPILDSIEILSKARALDFSDNVSNPSVKKSNKKSDLSDNDISSVSTTCEVLKSPVRQCSRLLQTPTRQSPRLNSPLRSSIKKKTTDTKGVKKLSFAPTSPKSTTVLQSPRKSSLQQLEQVRRSPRKHQSPAKHLQSPRKLLQSPRKLDLMQDAVRRSPRKHNIPLRLARQQALCYQQAKRALHTALPDQLLCREKQYNEVNDFLDRCLNKKQSGSLYISGAPGTGKTAVLSKTLQRLQDEKLTQVIYINCMSVKNSQAIFNRVLGELRGRDSSLSCKDAQKHIEKSLAAKGDMVCMIMDEVDQLDSKNQDVLYTMFEWPHLAKSRLVLIGIANALDLTDRILPRLQAKPKCKPKLMNFPPYSKDQIVTIIKHRLTKVEVGGEQVLDNAAVQFCARKVAAVAGDMRKALDVCRRAIEMVEAEVKRQQVLSAVCGSPSKRATNPAPSVPKRISVAHIMRCVNEVYGASTQSAHAHDSTVPLQQKLAVCTLLLTLQRAKSKQVPLGKLHENYCKVCRKQEVASVDQSEFLSLCSLIEARGIMGLKKAKDTRMTKVTLKLDEGELERTLKDKTLVSKVLKDGIPA